MGLHKGSTEAHLNLASKEYSGAYLNGAYYPFSPSWEYVLADPYTSPASGWQPLNPSASLKQFSGSSQALYIRCVGHQITKISAAADWYHINQPMPGVVWVYTNGLSTTGTMTVTLDNGKTQQFIVD